MKLKGVCYDVGAVMGFNWRPHFNPKIVHRELEIIKNDLHCNAVRISGLNIDRLMTASEDALNQGLEVWFYPALWDRRPDETLKYITKAAAFAEKLNQRHPNHLIFCVEGELTLFMRGIIEGKNLIARIKNPHFIAGMKAGEHNKPLNAFLAKANDSVRAVFHGKVTYASLIWEAVDWSLFDFVGVDHYRAESIKDRYVEMLRPSFSHNKPVVVTEFGCSTYHGGVGSEGLLSSAGLGGDIVDRRSQFFHYKIPLLGKLIRPRVNGSYLRDEGWQARQLVDQLSVLDRAGVYGAFISEFVSQIKPYSSDPRYDLDMASASLVKSYENGTHGTTYPDMPWEPKESFRAVADYYAKH